MEDFEADGTLYRLFHDPKRGRKDAPSSAQMKWLTRGLQQPGGKLPLFDRSGRRYPSKTIAACIAKGWAEPWFHNPIKPDWQICRLTDAGRKVLQSTDGRSAHGGAADPKTHF